MLRAGFVLAAALATARPSTGLAQQLILGADVGKTEFFEGEPIYLVVRLQNVSTDTAWVTFYDGGTPPVALSLHRGTGTAPLVRILSYDYLVRPDWRGDPIAPRTGIMSALVLQDLMGEEWDSRSHLFVNYLSAGQYELHVQLEAHEGVPGATPLTLTVPPMSFRVRKRTDAEEAEVTELETMRQMSWDSTSVGGYLRAASYQATLIRWLEHRVGERPDDPFLPLLLDYGVYHVGKPLAQQIAAGKLPRFDPDTSEVVNRLRLAVIRTQRSSTGGARLVQTLSARHPDQVVALAASLGSTASGEMARYQAERAKRVQQTKKQLPR